VAAVHLENIFKRYKGTAQPAVDDVSLSVQDGEFMVLLGPSGCGKSTTLRMIAGLEEPDSGTVHLAGKSMHRVPPQDRDLAMVFQGYALYPHMKVREILAFPLKMRGAPRAEQEKKVAEILNKDQMARLKQLELQQEGVRALNRSEVQTALKLSADQKSKLDKINEESRAAMQQAFQGLRGNNGQQPSDEERRAAREKFQALQTATEAKVLAVLTDAQKKQFEGMQGTKFTFPEGRRGGNRRPNNNGNA
jgi:ABC-type sugar transport system ATPase subunit